MTQQAKKEVEKAEIALAKLQEVIIQLVMDREQNELSKDEQYVLSSILQSLVNVEQKFNKIKKI